MEKRRAERSGFVPALLAAALAAAGCAPPREHKLEGRTMGTTWHVTANGRAGDAGLRGRIERRLDEINRTFSTYIERSRK